MRRPPAYLLAAWLGLVALLAGNIALAFIGSSALSLVANLAVAAVMAAILLTVFMELRRADPLLWAFAGAGFFWLAIFFSLTAADYLTRYSYAPI